MSYREIEGNLLDMFDQGEFEMIGHGANCQSSMDAGIAAQIKQRYPSVYYADVYSSLSPLEKLGNYSCNKPETIFNFYTQFYGGPDADYLWLKSALRKFASEYGNLGFIIGLPQICCGIGGLKWEIVKKIIQKELTGFDVTIVIYKENKENNETQTE